MNENIIIGSDRATPRGPQRGVAFLSAAAALLAAGTWVFLGRDAAPASDELSDFLAIEAERPAPVVTSVKLAFLDGSGDGVGASAGCDALTLVTVPVRPTADPVDAALGALFSAATSTDLTPGNFVAGQEDLVFDRAEAHDDDFHVYLAGKVSYAGVCDDPRLQIQIEETVRANHPAVDEVEIFLNDLPYETPNERGEEAEEEAEEAEAEEI